MMDRIGNLSDDPSSAERHHVMLEVARLAYAMRDTFVEREPMTRLTDTLALDVHYVDPTTLVTFLGLHDQTRFLSEPGATVAGLELAFTFLLTTRGT